MNQYQQQNAAIKIDGYYTPQRDAANVERVFLSAQDECLRNMRASVTNVEQMTKADFLKYRKTSKRNEVEHLQRLIADIKAWDVDQHMTIPHHLRVRIEDALAPNPALERRGGDL